MQTNCRWPGLRTLLIPLSALVALAGSCSKNDSGSSGESSCTLSGSRCEFGCSSVYGCVECLSSEDCEPGAPVCVLGQCAACSDNDHCGTGESCYPANHTCQTSCTSDTDCTGIQDAPICNTTTGACVGCLSATDCPAEAPVCSPDRSQCSACATRNDCGVAAPACDLQTGQCVECLADSDCGSAYLCSANHQCYEKCASNADCPLQGGGMGLLDRNAVCDTTTGACVECLTDIDCTSSTGGPICNLELNRCTECQTDGECPTTAPICNLSNGTCAQCLVDTDCADTTTPICQGQQCVQCRTAADCTDAATPNCRQGTCSA